MIEKQVSDDAIKQWLKGPVCINLLMPPPLPWTKSELIHQLLMHPYGNMKGSSSPAKRVKKPPASKKRWTAFGSDWFDVAVRTDGTVVVKGSGARRFTLWIHPNGDAGTTAENELELEHLANEKFSKVLWEITDLIREWAGQVYGRKLPQGPFLLLERSLKAVNWRKYEYRENTASDGFFFTFTPWEWPFVD